MGFFQAKSNKSNCILCQHSKVNVVKSKLCWKIQEIRATRPSIFRHLKTNSFCFSSCHRCCDGMAASNEHILLCAFSCICIHKDSTYTNTDKHTNKHNYIQAHTYACLHTLTRTHILSHTLTRTDKHSHTLTHTHTHIRSYSSILDLNFIFL